MSAAATAGRRRAYGVSAPGAGAEPPGLTGPGRSTPWARHTVETWNSDTSATADSRSPRSPTATGSPTARRSRTTSPRSACGPRSTAASARSTPPTSTPTPRPRRSSARRSRASGASRLEIFTKVYWPTGPGGKNDTGLSRKHIMESINGSLQRLQTDYVDLYQAHRYDTETPLEETMQAFADIVRQGKALYIGVSEWTADQIRDGRRARQGARLPAHLEPAAVLDAVARHRGRGRADVRGARRLPDRVGPDRAGRADRQVPARPAAAGGLARHRREGRRRHDQALHERRRAHPRAGPQAGRRRARPDDGPARRRLGAAERQRRRRAGRRLADPSRSPRTSRPPA